MFKLKFIYRKSAFTNYKQVIEFEAELHYMPVIGQYIIKDGVDYCIDAIEHNLDKDVVKIFLSKS